MKFKLIESLESFKLLTLLESKDIDIFNKILEFNDKCNNYEYIIYNDSCEYKETVSSDDFMNNYKMLTPMEFEKYGGGICWDYVAYEADYFKNNFPSIKFKAYYWIGINNNNDPTHTFILFNYDDYVWWFESSWKSKCGIYQFESESKALDYITYLLRKDVKDYKYQYIIEYNPLDRHLFGMNCIQFMGYMENKIKQKRKEVNDPEKPLNKITKSLSYNEHSKKMAENRYMIFL